MKAARATMLEAIEKDCLERFGSDETFSNMHIAIAYSGMDLTEAKSWEEEVRAKFPNHDIIVASLSLSVSCHIGPGAIAIACTKKLTEDVLTK